MFPATVSQYGKDEPLPQRHNLRAGPLTAVLEGGDLRYVKLGGETVVLRLYAAIRDRNWNTIEPRFLSYELDQDDDGFSVRFVAENVSNDVDFEWQGSITGTPTGLSPRQWTVWRARASSETASAGASSIRWSSRVSQATVETPNGTVEGAFPDLISPHQPFVDMQSIAYATSGRRDRDPVRRRSLGDGGSAQLDRRLVQDLLDAATAAVPD